jgi:hypothetical protein
LSVLLRNDLSVYFCIQILELGNLPKSETRTTKQEQIKNFTFVQIKIYYFWLYKIVMVFILSFWL